MLYGGIFLGKLLIYRYMLVDFVCEIVCKLL